MCNTSKGGRERSNKGLQLNVSLAFKFSEITFGSSKKPDNVQKQNVLVGVRGIALSPFITEKM